MASATMNAVTWCFRRLSPAAVILAVCRLCELLALANPSGGSVSQGLATITSKGSQLTIKTSDHACLNWQSFNIGLGETTTFVQPSASSVAWNNINDSQASQILGNLNANGYVVLQNQNGFYIGGQASITAHGLIMTTAPIPMPDLSSGDAWHFNAPPPAAKIINYGQIGLTKGGSVFLIAHDIENHGRISAPAGKIGLCAGKEVLVSERPDGRGLSALVTLPEGSVDNDGQLIADAGFIAMHARVVNQGGLVEANSVRKVNGTIELVAGDAVNLGANSVITASGDAKHTSAGGSILIKSDNTFSDQTGSAIHVSGGGRGGKGGQVEISAPRMKSLLSGIDGHAAAGFTAGRLFLDPDTIILASSGDPATLSGGAVTINANDLPSDTLTLNVYALNSLIYYNSLSQISLSANSLIELTTPWMLPPSQDPTASLTLRSGNNIILDDGSYIAAGNNWSVSLFAGPQNLPSTWTPPVDRTRIYGIYLDGTSSLQTRNGNINLWAANEVLVNAITGTDPGAAGNNGIRTVNGGSITVTAEFGDVNTGGNVNGYAFNLTTPPYYAVNAFQLGGISTAAGGSVTIAAGRDVTSYLPLNGDFNAQYDGGTGAFGPGNVTITAGGSVSGHYVLANGVGSITAAGDIGNGGFALSLIKGKWNVDAPNGNIYLQEVRNPNGVFDADAGYHVFDYDPHASVFLRAGNSVEITGTGAPRINGEVADNNGPLLLFPPTLDVTAGRGGFLLDKNVILFPSPFGELRVTSAGDFHGPVTADGKNVRLEMSDSGSSQWTGLDSFGTADHAATPPELNNPNPVQINVSGSINNIDLYPAKAAQITVGGDMFNSGFIGENLHRGDVTSINVAGKIYYPPVYTPIVALDQGIIMDPKKPVVSADPQLPLGSWDSILSLLVDPSLVVKGIPANATVKDLVNYANQDRFAVFHQGAGAANPGFVYNPGVYSPITKKQEGIQLAYQFRMDPRVKTALEGPLEIIKMDRATGYPKIVPGQATLGQDPTKSYFVTETVDGWSIPKSVIDTLYDSSQHSTISAASISPGFQIGGPGRFDIHAASMDLGSSGGILSWGFGTSTQVIERNYSSLAGLIDSGAAVNVKVDGDLGMLTSTIASVDGGNVTVNCGGELDLGLKDFAFSSVLGNVVNVAFGIYTSGHSDVHVTAVNDINIETARIATFNGGNVFVESLEGDVNAGSGANSSLVVPVIYMNPKTGLPATGRIGSGTKSDPRPYGSGILAISPTSQYQTSGGNLLPGNITVETPNGDIVSTLAGIQQFALNGNIAGGPTITLTSGRDIDLGAGGVVGGTVNITAEGSIKGLIVSRQNTTISAGQSFSGTVLSGGTANVSATGGSISGTIVGIGGVNASGGGGITATMLGQNVSIGGGAAQSTLGTSAAATSTSQAAAQQASSDTRQVASNDTQNDDENKKGKRPTLTRRTGRVTVILPPKAS